MTTTQTPPKGHQLHAKLHEVKSQRDDLRKKVDLFEADSKVELATLESQIENMERELKTATDETAEAIAGALDKLSKAFHRLGKKAAKERHSA